MLLRVREKQRMTLKWTCGAWAAFSGRSCENVCRSTCVRVHVPACVRACVRAFGNTALHVSDATACTDRPQGTCPRPPNTLSACAHQHASCPPHCHEQYSGVLFLHTEDTSIFMQDVSATQPWCLTTVVLVSMMLMLLAAAICNFSRCISSCPSRFCSRAPS